MSEIGDHAAAERLDRFRHHRPVVAGHCRAAGGEQAEAIDVEIGEHAGVLADADLELGDAAPGQQRRRLLRRGDRLLHLADAELGAEAEAAQVEQLAVGAAQRGKAAAGVGGLGLGLHLVREIVEAHGGEVRVETHSGEGSTFTVELPLDHH